ncbi:hypothetical protein A9K97_gp427 [Tokyovirus A1]|uniref:hypothetical protein n=1 Tax=Tokyovirus A1 TaxID=1826170 RepID=UPI0007A96B14|nr:hypothetical protein A9K97_gp427 [Tokyovirus A1]BAU79924.1 hypothetical protein [Tokyovirus A1]
MSTGKMDDKKKIAKTNAERQREWAKRNPEIARERNREWYERNKKTLLAKKAKQYAEITEEEKELKRKLKKERKEKEEKFARLGEIVDGFLPNISFEELRSLLQTLAPKDK